MASSFTSKSADSNSGVNRIFENARTCTRCYPDDEIYVPLPDPNNSMGKSEIIFINERPGRVGTGKSGYVSFDNDDPTATFFRECFEAASLDREKVFITNACICHPVIDGYKDTQPKIAELVQCHFWLHQQLEVVRPSLIVTVGWSALQSVLRYYGRWPVRDKLTFGAWVGRLIDDNDPWIYPVAHTSLKGRANRKATLQHSDWLEIPKILRRARILI